MNRKLCGGCLRVKDLSEFQKSRTRRIGVQSLCRECANARKRERRRCRPATMGLFLTDESDTSSRPLTVVVSGSGGPGTVTLPSAPREPADRKTQGRCHRKVRKALVLGVLSRPQRCSVCGRVFLCRTCHKIVHGSLSKKFES